MTLSKLSCSCYDAGHTWTTSCADSAVGVGAISLRQSLKIYGSVYIASYLLRCKKPTVDDLKKLTRGILQSSAFLGFNGFGFIGWFCICRYFYGHFTKFSSGFLPAFIASVLAILIERPSRRGLLALYVTNVASETVWRMLEARGLVKSIPKGEVLILMATLAALVPWFRRNIGSRDSVHSIAKFVIGRNEYCPTSSESQSATSHSVRRNPYRHPLCKHRSTCFKYVGEGAVRKFVTGFGIHATLTVALSLMKLLKRPSLLPQLLLTKKNFKFGLFLGGSTGIIRGVLCLLRWVTGKDEPSHGAIAGFLGGLPMLAYKSTTLASYLMWKTVEVIYKEGIASGVLPSVPGFEVLLYSFSTALLFHTAVFEPHNVKPSYWKFLTSLTENRFAEMNRQLLAHFVADAPSQTPFWPKYEPEFVSQQLRAYMGLRPNFSIDT